MFYLERYNYILTLSLYIYIYICVYRIILFYVMQEFNIYSLLYVEELLLFQYKSVDIKKHA